MNRPFSAVREGLPYAVPLMLAGLIGLWLAWGSLWVILPFAILIVGLFVVNFFRDPPRRIPTDAESIVSPADGVVVGVDQLEESQYYDGPCQCIAIFLNIFNVHVNRMPDDATVTRIHYQPGRYVNAMSERAGRINESNNIWLDTPRGRLTVRQISGAVARRIVCRCAEGDSLRKGDKFGMIKFGSRTELYLPVESEISVRPGDKVRAGSTVVARAGDAIDDEVQKRFRDEKVSKAQDTAASAQTAD